MIRSDIYTEDELKVAERQNYDFVTQISPKLDNLKGIDVGWSNPRKGKMIINYKGVNYLVDIEPLGEGTLETAMKNYRHIFN